MQRFPVILRLCGFLLVLVGAPSLAADQAQEQSADAAPEEQQLSVEDILKRDPSREDYVDDTRCINSHLIRDVEVIDAQHVSFQLRRNEFYLVQLPFRCPGLERGRPVMYEANASRLCAHDAIRALYEYGLGRFEPGMRCAIPGFQSVTKEQLLMLKDALKAERRRARDS